MNRLQKLALILFLFVPCAVQARKNQTVEKPRNLIVLIDNGIENVALARHFVYERFISGVYQQAAPMLVSASVLRMIVEAREEFALQAEVPGTHEEKILTRYTTIQDRLNYWYHHTESQMLNAYERMHSATEMVNKELCCQAARKQLRDEGVLIDNECDLYRMAHRLALYIMPFDRAQWSVYRITPDFYLFVPHKYLQMLRDTSTVKRAPSGFSRDEILLGLKVDQCEHIKEPLSCNTIHFDPIDRAPGNFVAALKKLFITRQELKKQELLNEFIIYCTGHGDGSLDPQVPEMITNVGPDEFREFLDFLATEIKVHTLWYNSCMAGGYQAEKIYADRVYPFTICLLSFTDAWAYSPHDYQQISGLNDDHIFIENIACDPEADTLHLRVFYHEQWEKFFKKVARTHLTQNQLLSVLDYAVLIEDIDIINNIPLIRLAGSNSCIPLYDGQVCRITDSLLNLKKVNEQHLAIDDKRVILLETRMITVPLEISTERFPIIVSTTSDSLVHCIETLEADKHELVDILEGLWPLAGTAYRKTYVIKNLTCLSDVDAPYAKLMGMHDSQLQLSDVVIRFWRHKWDASFVARISCKGPDGRIFGGHAFFVDYQDKRRLSVNALSKPQLRAFYPLDGVNAEAYSQYVAGLTA